MQTFIITDDVAEKILLRHEENNGSWILVSESKITFDKGEKARRCATVLNPEEADKIADIIKRENVK